MHRLPTGIRPSLPPPHTHLERRADYAAKTTPRKLHGRMGVRAACRAGSGQGDAFIFYHSNTFFIEL
jgi:hypothetical protein